MINTTYEIKYDQILDTSNITKSEEEDLRLMQEIVDACPSMKDDIFGTSHLGNRYNNLYNKKHLCDMSSITSVLAKEISDQIDADMMKIMNECFTSSATNPLSIERLEKLMGI